MGQLCLHQNLNVRRTPNDHTVIEDYRRYSYKDRLRILRDLQAGGPFFENRAGKRLVASVNGPQLNLGVMPSKAFGR